MALTMLRGGFNLVVLIIAVLGALAVAVPVSTRCDGSCGDAARTGILVAQHKTGGTGTRANPLLLRLGPSATALGNASLVLEEHAELFTGRQRHTAIIDGSTVDLDLSGHRWFRGHVQGSPGSYVRLSSPDGELFHGMVHLSGTETFVLERHDAEHGRRPHVVYIMPHAPMLSHFWSILLIPVSPVYPFPVAPFLCSRLLP